MTAQLHADRLAALDDEPLDWRFKGLPASWWGRTAAQVSSLRPAFFDDGPSGPVCVLRESALVHNLTTMSKWCADREVELAPHGKTHMAPQLLARQFRVGATAVTAATVSQVRVYRAFGVDRVLLANEVVDLAGLAWLAAEIDADPDFHVVCWVDSVAGVELMTTGLAGAQRQLDVCVEVGMPDGRTGCRTDAEVDDVARAAAASPRLRLVGVSGYEASAGQQVTPETVDGVRAYLRGLRATTGRLAGLFETDTVIVTAGGSTYPDAVADELAGDWPARMTVRTILRSGCYLTHDHGLYARTSPLPLRPALQVWAQVVSRPEPELALVTMGRRDVSFDAGLPLPLSLPGARVVELNDQHAYLQLAAADDAPVGSWLPFGISHPCTTFDKWPLIPVLDDENRVTALVRTFF
ncbi:MULTISPECIES: alanine racemase [Mycobacterium]|uniref:Amino acid deaminase n=1 Tax=Mycobacterium syngnathidarum TaxID=1908205 RepID=A0A1S1KG55_9MYCO|nr:MULTISPECIES: alanine racemase [Mycobacterium]MCG7607318.1 alanine racemase [Mycobacterium sp. CnD-18-1]OHU07177.1 amino acid deaminase [Mycobacterium syngnathidarum]